MIAELDKPIPMLVLSFITLVALIGALFFPSKNQQAQEDRMIVKKRIEFSLDKM